MCGCGVSCLKFRLKTIVEIGLSQGLDYEKIPYLTYLRSKSVCHMITAKEKIIVYRECTSDGQI